MNEKRVGVMLKENHVPDNVIDEMIQVGIVPLVEFREKYSPAAGVTFHFDGETTRGEFLSRFMEEFHAVPNPPDNLHYMVLSAVEITNV